VGTSFNRSSLCAPRRQHVLAALALFTAAAAIAPAARANIYLQYGGITGAVTAPNFQGTIAANTFSLGAVRGIATTTGGSNRTPSFPDITDATLTGPSSIASVSLFLEALDGLGQNATVFITAPAGPKQSEKTYAQWDFTNTLLSSFNTTSTGSAGPSTSVDAYTLNFTKFTYTWNNYDSLGAISGTESFTYDIAQAKVVSSAQAGDVSNFALVTFVPEPSSAAALLALAAPLVARRRRRRRQSRA
jgi:type VI protein secretion system component Hcp